MICEGCGCVFCPDSDGTDREPGHELPRYCTKRCKKRSSERRNKRYVNTASRRSCQRKTGRYATEEDAETALTSLNSHGAKELTGYYPCGGHWHLTSQGRADVRVSRRGEHGELTLETLRDLLAGEQEMTA